MTPNPKKPPIRLSKKEYQALRLVIYTKQYGICKGCGFWFPENRFSLHHIKSRGAGGDDSEENVEGYCVGCHPD